MGLCPGGLCPGGLCPWDLCPGGSLSRGVSVQGGLCPGGLCLGGLCPRGLRPGWSLSGGSLSREGLCQEDPPHTVTCGRCASYWNAFLGPFTPSVSVNAAMTLVILFSLKTVESLQNGLQTYSEATSLFSMRTESQASSQR